MIEFILGFCLAVIILMILSKQKNIKEMEQLQRDNVQSLSRLERINADKLLEITRIRLHLSDISSNLSAHIKPKKARKR